MDEAKILESIEEKELVTTEELARRFSVSWNTMDAVLKRLEARGFIKKHRLGRVNVWTPIQTKQDFWFEVAMRLSMKFLDFGRSECSKDNDELNIMANILSKQVGREVASYFTGVGDRDSMIKEVLMKICYQMSSRDMKFDINIEEKDGKIILTATQCPMFQFSAQEPLLCSICNGIKSGILENILKKPVTIETIKSMPHGDSQCVLHIRI